MTDKKEITTVPFSVNANIRYKSIDKKKRTFNVDFASDDYVEMWTWSEGRILESLSMDDGAMRTTRLNSGAPFLNNHRAYGDVKETLGKVVEGSVKIENGRASCTIQMSKRASLDELWGDVEDGIIQNISVGYDVHETLYVGEENGVKKYRATDWDPYEVSFVCVPADVNAQVRAKNRSGEMVIKDEPVEKTDETPEVKPEKTESSIQRDKDLFRVRKAKRSFKVK